MGQYLTDRDNPVQVVLSVLCRLGILVVPTGLLVGAALRYPPQDAMMLWFGAAFQGVVCALSVVSRRTWEQPLGPQLMTLYLIALGSLWFGDPREDWYAHFARAVLLVVPLLVFGMQTLQESGAPALRRANVLAQRLSDRKDWPSDLQACRFLPEVKAFRAALAVDAGPALALLQHPRPEVRVAALAALEFRKDWRPGQAELVLQLAQRAEQPVIRAASVAALGNVDDRSLVETLAQFLHDNSLEVRRAAVESLLWDSEHRWAWIRFAVRRILADPLFFNDGPLLPDGQILPQEAVHDLTAWCAEKGILSSRAAATLGAHYDRALAERPEPDLVEEIRKQLGDPHAPAILRLELAKVLQQHQELNEELLENLLDPANPATLRLIACETILCEPREGTLLIAGAESALRDLARLPNREIALAAADVVQRKLGVDLGLGLGQPLPPVHTRQAADITRRVQTWAARVEEQAEDPADSHLMPLRR